MRTGQGAGMEPEVADRAFEPFFTTKPEGEGTGLGLATAYGIVQRAGGKIELSSSPGKGTAVHVYVPAALEEALPETAPAGARPPGGSETILLVEDEDAVRRLTRRILEGAGYAVLDAAGPNAAAEVWRKHGGSVDLLLTDVVMPGRSGVRLWQDLAEERPELRVVYMSGYAGDVLNEPDGGEIGGEFLEKPFSSTDLLRAVRSALR
jgi:two-component system, cell cycle sensor histidine kinase and response regulator CckA